MATFLERKNEERQKYAESQMNEERDFVRSLREKWTEANRMLDEQRSACEEEKMRNEEYRKETVYESCVAKSESGNFDELVATLVDLRSIPDYKDANDYACRVKEKLEGILSGEKQRYVEEIAEIRIKNKLCQHCGNKFEKSVCSSCGNPKDY